MSTESKGLAGQARENERRSKARFEIHRELRYKVLKEGMVTTSGAGQTVDVGSGGVAFVADGELTAGEFIELSISWPVLLEERCAMRLIVFGRIVRSQGRHVACTVDKYEFRTQARTYQMPIRNDSMLQRWADSFVKESVKMRAGCA